MPTRRLGWFLLVAAGFILLSLTGTVVRLYTDYLWFGEVGFRSIFTTILTTQVILGVAVGVLTAGILYVNFRLADHLASQSIPLVFGEMVELLNWPVWSAKVKRLVQWVSLFFGFILGLDAAERWQTYLLFRHGIPFRELDPLFHRDIGFYVFTLPFLSLLRSYLLFLVVIMILGTAIIYLLRRHISLAPQFFRMTRPARLHLSVIAILFLSLLAFHFYLNTCHLVYSNRGVATGASYADMRALLPALHSLIYICLAAAFLIFISLFRRNSRLTYIAFGIVIFAYIGGYLYLSLIQKFIVAPNEIAKETPYIAINVTHTRKAYNLDRIEERTLTAEAGLTTKTIEQNRPTINNIRLWDHAPLLETYGQLQEIRTYYNFVSVDNDRYTIDGEYRQVMLSPRELSYEHLPSRVWINERLTYTHGYGLTLGPVNRITAEGLPEFFIKDIPPVISIPSLKIDRPEIYYGEIANTYVFVKTHSKEFDYPSGDENVYTTYADEGGVPVASLLRKALFAMRFGSLKILLSTDITVESRALYYRNIIERLQRIAPFLRYDRDPYMVISNGRLYWICDAYTTTDAYPYSQPIEGLGNYFRNAVKAVIDAYNGHVTLYIADPADPLIRTYTSIFPGNFAPLDVMPEDIRRHLRYPQDLFAIQAAMYNKYHMTDPQVFYNQEDLWEIPTSPGGQGAMEPYYTIMRLPGGDREEFILMLPFTPRRKDNLSAWMCARSDGPNYGRLVVYLFPKRKLVYGPRQISSRINQDPEISRQLSLWDQRGSQVIHGNLLVIPIEESLIYVQPLYLKAETGQIPELRRVIVAYENSIAMEETLEKSLNTIFGKKDSVISEIGTSVPSEIRAGEPSLTDTASVVSSDLATQAVEHYERAQKLMRDGNWAGYGEEIKKLGDVLKKMKGKK